MRILGLDIGTKNVGVAVSDEMLMMAHARGVIKRENDEALVVKILEFVDLEKITKIVIGFPINMNGTIGERAEHSIKIKKLIEGRSAVPVELWDERLSTKEAEGIMIEASMSRKKRKKSIDKLAAQLILQSYLDATREQEL